MCDHPLVILHGTGLYIPPKTLTWEFVSDYCYIDTPVTLKRSKIHTSRIGRRHSHWQHSTARTFSFCIVTQLSPRHHPPPCNASYRLPWHHNPSPPLIFVFDVFNFYGIGWHLHYKVMGLWYKTCTKSTWLRHTYAMYFSNNLKLWTCQVESLRMQHNFLLQ